MTMPRPGFSTALEPIFRGEDEFENGLTDEERAVIAALAGGGAEEDERYPSQRTAWNPARGQQEWQQWNGSEWEFTGQASSRPVASSSGGGGSTATGPRVPVGLTSEQEIIDAGGKKVAPGRYEVPINDGTGRVVGYYQDQYNPGLFIGSAPVKPTGTASTASNRVVTLTAKGAGTTNYETDILGAPGGAAATRQVTVGDLIEYQLQREGITPTGSEQDAVVASNLARANHGNNVNIIRTFGREPTGDPIKDAATAAVLQNDARSMVDMGIASSYTDAVQRIQGPNYGPGADEMKAGKYAYRPSHGLRNAVDYWSGSEDLTERVLGEESNAREGGGAMAKIERQNELNSKFDYDNSKFEPIEGYAEGGTIVTDDPIALVNMRTGRAIGVTSEYGQKERTSWGDGKIVIDPMTRGFADGGQIADIDAQIASLRADIAKERERDEPVRSRIDALSAQIKTLEAQKAALNASPDPIDTLPGMETTPGEQPTNTPTTPTEAPFDPMDPFASIADLDANTAEAAYLAKQQRQWASTDYHYTDYGGIASPTTVTLPFSAVLGGEGGDRVEFTDEDRDELGYLRTKPGGPQTQSTMNRMKELERKYIASLTQGANGGGGFVNLANMPSVPGLRFTYPNIGAEISALQTRLLTMPVNDYTKDERTSTAAAINKLREAQMKAYPWLNRPPPLNQPTLAEDPVALVAGVGKKGKKNNGD